MMPDVRLRSAEKLVLLVLLCVLYGLYVWGVHVSSSGSSWWIIDLINGKRIFTVDDAYRFFLIGGAFLHPSYYSWSYILPVQLLLDGTLSVLFRHNLEVLRAFHAVFYLTSLCFLCLALLRVMRYRWLSFLAMAVLGLMPICLFVSISFYAEAWMLVGVIWIIHGYLNLKYRQVLVLSALAPLLRPEGVFFLLSAAVHFLRQRQYRRLVLLFVPSVLYFFWVLCSTGLVNFYAWRVPFYQIQKSAFADYSPLNGYLTDAFGVFHVLGAGFVLLVVLSFANRKLYSLWQPLLASGIWMLFWMGDIALGAGSFEIRYFVPIVPFLVVMWVLGLEVLLGWGERFSRPLLAKSLSGVLILVSLLGFALQSSYLELFATSFVEGKVTSFSQLDTALQRFTPGYGHAKDWLLALVHQSTEQSNPLRVNTVLVTSEYYWLFYFLDSSTLPSDVVVSFTPVSSSYLGVNRDLTHVYGMFGRGHRYAFYHFSRPVAYQPLALYVGGLTSSAPDWTFGGVPVHLFSYQITQGGTVRE